MNKKKKLLKIYSGKNSISKNKLTFFRTMEKSNNNFKNKTNFKKKIYTSLSMLSKKIIQWTETI
jgi:hypothetical protein